MELDYNINNGLYFTKKKQKGMGLSVSGGSLYPSGQIGGGRMYIGNEIIKLAKHNIHTTPHGALGLAFLHLFGHQLKGIKKTTISGSGLSHPKVVSHIKMFLKKNPYFVKNKNITKAHVNKFINAYKNKLIHINDLFGPDAYKKGDKILNLLSSLQSGGNFWNDLKGSFKKVGHSVGQFFKGATKYKPHDLLRDLSTVSGALGSAISMIPDPRAQGIATGLRVGQKVLQKTSDFAEQHGRGIQYGSGILPKKWVSWIKKNKGTTKKILKAIGMGVSIIGATVTAKNLHTYLKKNPQKLNHANNLVKQNYDADYQDIFMPNNYDPPSDDDNIYGHIVDTKRGGSLYYSGRQPLTMNKCKCPSKSNKMYKKEIGSRAQVMHGGALMTHKGETADMLCRNRHGRIVLRSKMNAGLKGYAKRKNKR